MYSIPAAEDWFRDAIASSKEALAPRQPIRIESPASDSSVDTRESRRREDPSSGRGNTERATTVVTADSDSLQYPPRWAGRGHREKRQSSPNVDHASDSDGNAPSSPPQITRHHNPQRIRVSSPRVHPRTDASTCPRAYRRLPCYHGHGSPHASTGLLSQTATASVDKLIPVSSTCLLAPPMHVSASPPPTDNVASAINIIPVSTIVPAFHGLAVPTPVSLIRR